ncbi:MAG: hypothetical protein PHN78_08565 [Dehalococcoidales bacterium]|nr:hypothetical protein [Dehalococcoidales bacterium]
MGWTTENLTPEQQELLDSGLRMLAHMIAETHLRRVALKKKNEYLLSNTEHPGLSHNVPEESVSEDQLESNDE